MTKRYAASVALFITIAFANAFAGDDLWQPITAKDWAVKADSARHFRTAVMLFEKITADDEELAGGKSTYTIYDRIRIFSAKGRDEADVVIPYLEDRGTIEEIIGRTVLPDGKEIVLEKAQIREKEVLSSEEVKVKQKSFSLSGVTDDCIIEYQIKFSLTHENSEWRIQKNIPLLHGEYLWKFFRFWNTGDQYMNQQARAIQKAYLSPNFYWSNTSNQGMMEPVGDPNKPEAGLFTIDNVGALQEEPSGLSRSCLQARLYLYYGDPTPADQFWSDKAVDQQKWIDKYTEDDDRVKTIVNGFSSLPTDSEKIVAAFNWIGEHMTNSSYTDKQKNGKSFSENDDVNDVLKHGYGSSWELNMVFYSMMKTMKIEAKFAYFVNRDEHFFIRSVKRWSQFDGTAVVLGNATTGYRFYSPGTLYLPMGYMPRYAEGTQALVVSSTGASFPVIPFSPADSNRIVRQYALTMSPEGKFAGWLHENRTGQPARYYRRLLHGLDTAAQLEVVQKHIVDYIEKAEVDSITIVGHTSVKEPVRVKGRVKFSGSTQQAGAHQLILPYSSMIADDNPFKSESRRSPILFDYPYNYNETMTIALPAGYSVEGLPPDTVYKNRIGSCKSSSTLLDTMLIVQRFFTLKVSSLSAEAYSEVRQLFGTLEALDRAPIVVARKK